MGRFNSAKKPLKILYIQITTFCLCKWRWFLAGKLPLSSFKDTIQISKICTSHYFSGAKNRILQLSGFGKQFVCVVHSESQRGRHWSSQNRVSGSTVCDSLDKAKKRVQKKAKKWTSQRRRRSWRKRPRLFSLRKIQAVQCRGNAAGLYCNVWR